MPPLLRAQGGAWRPASRAAAAASRRLAPPPPRRAAPRRCASSAAAASNPQQPSSSATAARPHPLPPEIKSVLFTEQQIAEAVARMGREISRDFEASGGELVVCGVLTGAFIFTADLARAIVPQRGLRVDFLRASSYGAAAESSGTVKVSGMGGDRDEARWRGKRVVLVEDIIDSGRTLRRLADELARLGAREVKVAALLDKQARRQADLRAMKPDYVGFSDCPDEFVVGYGLDYNEMFRTLPYIAALREEVYTPEGSIDDDEEESPVRAGSASP
jgi:hypoxanthine phosphoribosyltransferase